MLSLRDRLCSWLVVSESVYNPLHEEHALASSWTRRSQVPEGSRDFSEGTPADNQIHMRKECTAAQVCACVCRQHISRRNFDTFDASPPHPPRREVFASLFRGIICSCWCGGQPSAFQRGLGLHDFVLRQRQPLFFQPGSVDSQFLKGAAHSPCKIPIKPHCV